MRILVIKLGALGDFVQALGPMKSIRRFHPDAHITLLTTRPYAGLGEDCGYIDDVWIDKRPKSWNVKGWLALRARLRGGKFDRIYDLQTSSRSSRYFTLVGKGVQWSGIARGCSHPHANPLRDDMHTLERQAEQLRMAGIEETFKPSLDWLEGSIDAFQVGQRYALLVPGGAPHRPAKRWPAVHYRTLALWLLDQQITPVLLGTGAEADILDEIAFGQPGILNLCDRTGFRDIALLAKSAACAVGNDTGPMHMIAVAGCPSLVLYSNESNPQLCAQRGASVTILRRDSLGLLDPDEVTETIRELSI